MFDVTCIFSSSKKSDSFVVLLMWDGTGKNAGPKRRVLLKELQTVGFEPTPLTRPQLECGALDHSAKFAINSNLVL